MQPLPKPSGPAKAESDPGSELRRLEHVVAWVLRIGVISSVSIILVGLVVVFVSNPSFMRFSGGPSYRPLVMPGASFPHSLSATIVSADHGNGYGLIVLGLMVLLCTPIVRVAVGMLGFARQRDFPMASVTAAVLIILLASFAIGP